MNSKGQFSIIAALLVAVILIATVITTYSAIRYSTVGDQPQVLSAVDETNLALNQLLGFTVGYYGSILQVTGNASYAQNLTKSYLNSGLENIAEIRPELGLSFNVTSLNLQVCWFMTASYSSGNLTVKYDLSGLGLYGLTYSPLCRLDLQVLPSVSGSPALVSIFQDEDKPLNSLTKQNFKFYNYSSSDQTWNLTGPTIEPQVFSNGTYSINVPSGIDSGCYLVQVQDARGVMVIGSSFNRYATTVTWTSTYAGGDYVDVCNSNVSLPLDLGTHSNFTLQQYAPSGNFDSLKEGISSTTNTDFYPSNFTLRPTTTNTSGSLTDLQTDGGGSMQFHSYPSAFSAPTTFGYTTKGASTNNFGNIRGSRFTCTSGGLASSISTYLGYTSTPGTFGNTLTGSSGQSIIDTIRGQWFTSPTSPTIAQNIEAYLDVSGLTLGYTNTATSSDNIENYIRGSSFTCSTSGTIQSITAYIYTSSTYNMKAAIYDHSTNTKVGETQEQSVSSGTNWVTFTFTSPPSVVAGNTYVLVVWSQSISYQYAYLYYHSAGTNEGHYQYAGYGGGSFPSTASFTHDSPSREYCIYATYTPQNQNVKAAIYDSSNNLVASTQEVAVSADGWATFSFASPPTLVASTNYVLVAWAQSGSGSVNLEYSSASGGNGRSAGQSYGNWPPSVSFSSDTNQYCIHCNYITAIRAQAAIYSGSGGTFGDVTQEGSYFSGSIENTIRGSSFTCTESGTIQSITAYIYTSTTFNVKAAIYNDATNTKVAETQDTTCFQRHKLGHFHLRHSSKRDYGQYLCAGCLVAINQLPVRVSLLFYLW